MDGETLRRQRRALGLTQTELARRVGTTQQNMHRWESGECAIRHAAMLDLAMRYLALERLDLADADVWEVLRRDCGDG